MEANMTGKWQLVEVELDGSVKEIPKKIQEALNSLPGDARASAQILTTQLRTLSTGCPSWMAPVKVAIFFFAAEPTRIFTEADDEPEFLPEHWERLNNNI